MLTREQDFNWGGVIWENEVSLQLSLIKVSQTGTFFGFSHLFQHSEISSHNVPETQTLLCFEEEKGISCSFLLCYCRKIRMPRTG